MSLRVVLVLVTMLSAACGQERPALPATEDATDYNHQELLAAVDEFVANGRTPDAYRELFTKVLALRTGMDRSVAQEAELKLVVLALHPIQSVRAKPFNDQVEALALTVWPALISDPIVADAVILKRDPKPMLLPRADEDARAYLQRLCGGPLAGECKQVVPEYQGEILAAYATRRAMERARNALTDCVMCDADPGWRDAVHTWESLDRLASGRLHEIERRGHPDNWPIAGAAAQPASSLPELVKVRREAQINVIGEVVIGGQRYTGEERIGALRDLRADSDTIALHLRPELSLAQVSGILADARKSGARTIAVVARAPEYPWERRLYFLSKTGSARVGLRPTDSLQLLLHTLDHVAKPGTVARID